jgi:hypothetical protein
MKMLFVFVAASLAGCAGMQAPLPVMPSVAEVAATQAQLASVTDPAGFFRAGVATIIANCGTYFDQLVAIAQRNAQNAGQVTAATQALSAILGLAQVAPAPISIIGVVGPAITGAIANAQAGSPGGDHPAEMGTLVAAQMNVYLAAIGNPPADAPSAWMALYGLYRTCSPAGIETAKQQALADAPNHLIVPAISAPPLAPVSFAPRGAQMLARAAPAFLPALAPRAPWMGVPQVMVRTPPPAAFEPPWLLSQAIPEATIRKRLSNEHALIQRYGRNRVEGGPRTPPTPIVPLAHPAAPMPSTPPPVAPPVEPTPAHEQRIVPDEPVASAPIPPPTPTPPKPNWKF